MPVAVARLAAGEMERNSIESTNLTRVGPIYTDTENNITAVVKALTVQNLAYELLSAAFVNALGLPAPRAFLVLAEDGNSFSDYAPVHSSGLRMYFGSELSPHPIFYHQLISDIEAGLNLVAAYSEWGDIVAFDEWLANSDRHSQNLLYDGKTFYVFDHDRVFSFSHHEPTALKPDRAYPVHAFVKGVNDRLTRAARTVAAERATKVACLAATVNLDEMVLSSLVTEIGSAVTGDVTSVKAFLAARCSHLVKLCNNRLDYGGLL